MRNVKLYIACENGKRTTYKYNVTLDEVRSYLARKSKEGFGIAKVTIGWIGHKSDPDYGRARILYATLRHDWKDQPSKTPGYQEVLYHVRNDGSYLMKIRNENFVWGA